MSRRAEDVIPGPRPGWLNPSPTEGGTKLRVTIPGRVVTVRFVGGRVVQRGTAAELQRLVGLSEPALRAFAAARGWRVEADHA